MGENIWEYVRELDRRLREIEQTQAVHEMRWEQLQYRARQIPGWAFSVVGVVLTVIGLLITLALAGKLPWP